MSLIYLVSLLLNERPPFNSAKIETNHYLLRGYTLWLINCHLSSIEILQDCLLKVKNLHIKKTSFCMACLAIF